MAIWYHFFCDESGIHNRPDYWIGGIKLTPNRERRLRYASHNHRHNLTLDYKTSKWYRWNQLSYALNGKADQNRQPGRYISSVIPKDSRSDILLQLADVLLGAIAYSGDGSSAKGELSYYVRTHLSHKTKYGSKLFTIHKFTPTKK